MSSNNIATPPRHSILSRLPHTPPTLQMFYEKCTQGRPNTSVAGLLNGSGLLCSPRAVFIYPFYALVLQASGLKEWRRKECVNEKFSRAYSKNHLTSYLVGYMWGIAIAIVFYSSIPSLYLGLIPALCILVNGGKKKLYPM